MMYGEFMKNFLLADFNELLAVRLISASWAKSVWFPLSRHDVRRIHEKFCTHRFEQADGCYTQLGLLSPKTFDSYFLDMMYVEFMKNFLLADFSELFAVRLTSASWAQKRLFPNFWSWCTSSSWKIFFSPISASYWLLNSIRPPELKNVWFLIFRHDVHWVHAKIFFSPISTSYWLLDSFRPPEAKNVLFLLSRHDIRRVHEKFSSRGFQRAIGY